MGHTYTSLLSHCIFSTKDRLPLITPEIGDPLFAYLGGIVRSLNGVALIVGGVTDHVHILASFPPAIAMSDAMRLVKANSSKWANEEWPKLGGFAWQTGYAAFSVSRSSVDAVTAYIAGQEEHHRTVTFQEELIAFLKRHGIEYDERYIWQ
jgi:REP element-mobilizing transposase RayT